MNICFICINLHCLYENYKYNCKYEKNRGLCTLETRVKLKVSKTKTKRL